MNGNYIKIVCLVLIMFVAPSCQTIFEDVTGDGVDPTLVNLELQVELDLESVSDFADYDGTQTLSKSDIYNFRVIVEMYELSNIDEIAIRDVYYQSYDDIENFSFSKSFSLYAKEYRVLIWADVVDNIEDRDLFYNTADLNNIVPTDPYKGGSDLKHCFAEMVDIDLTPYRDEWNVIYKVENIMERPLARFEIITNDLEQFLEEQTKVLSETSETKADVNLENYTIKLQYDGYMPYGYNVETDLPNRAEQGIEFTTYLEPTSDGEARLSFDHLFVNHTESSVTVSMIVYNEFGEIATQTNSITIPLKRNKNSVVEGDFLTRSYVPGVSLDPSFDGDIEIWIGD
ncbi:MAG: DUF6562 domain-containing protein [Rikenellaceae bacterium]